MPKFTPPFEIRCPVHGEPLELFPDFDEGVYRYWCGMHTDVGDCIYMPSAPTPRAALIAALIVGDFLIPAEIEPPTDSHRWIIGSEGWWSIGRPKPTDVGYYLRHDEETTEVLDQWLTDRGIEV